VLREDKEASQRIATLYGAELGEFDGIGASELWFRAIACENGEQDAREQMAHGNLDDTSAAA
jgi:hypothetical protein